MKKEHAQKWVNALRSGEYTQCKGSLRKGKSFCCLGVLNDIFSKMNLAGGHYDTLNNYKKIGLNNAFGRLTDDVDEAYESLVHLNDSGHTFNEIADVIQIEYVEGL